MKLFYRKYGVAGHQPIIILHGLFGISDNWTTYARRLSMEGFEVITVDLRNHGRSPHSDVFNYLALTDDLYDFIDEHEIENPIIIGHSMGGKVAMRFALENTEMVKKLVVVDISLKPYGPRKNHLKIIEAMNAIDLNKIKSRNQVDAQLANYISELRIRQFILKNLNRTQNNTFEWRINIDGIKKNLSKMFDGIDTMEHFQKETMFIRGGASDYILTEDYDHIRFNFPNAEIITIEGASHWVHVEAMEKFYQLTLGFVIGNQTKRNYDLPNKL